jgi:putative tryptophan/tyrosine transport system substrate-binding protein
LQAHVKTCLRITVNWLVSASSPSTTRDPLFTNRRRRGLASAQHAVPTRASELDTAFQALVKGRTQAVIVLVDAMFFNERPRIAVLAAAARLPAVYGFRDHVDAGGLISYGVDLAENFHRAATYVHKILKGANPADLPVEFPTKFELVINLKAADALGIGMPPLLLARADEVVE